MSYIFRSDAVEIGERVVARREIDGMHTDVIGHVLSLDPLVIRPQEVGGYPSSLEAVEIPAEELKIIKRLSPRMVRNSDIRAVDDRTVSKVIRREVGSAGGGHAINLGNQASLVRAGLR